MPGEKEGGGNTTTEVERFRASRQGGEGEEM